MPTVDDQIELEVRMVQAGIERFEGQKKRLVDSGKESMTKHGRSMVSVSIDKVAEGVVDIQTRQSSNRDIAKKKLKGMNPEQVAYIALITVVDALSKRYTLLKIARMVGMHVETQARLTKWVDEQGKLAMKVIDKANQKSDAGFEHKRHGLNHKMNKEGIGGEWSNEERIHVGLRLIDKIIVTTGLFHIKTLKSRGKKTNYLEATAETLEWVRKFNEQRSADYPRYAPCIIPPKPWTDVWGGGYYSEVINNIPMVRVNA